MAWHRHGMQILCCLFKVDGPLQQMLPSYRFDAPHSGNDKRCHCVKSRCLKLYCDCFARVVYCSGCACADCHNTEDNAQLVASKRAGIREKNPEVCQL
jgi:hypothetical protein